MRAQIYSALATLRIGMDILFDKENLTLTRLCGHGGLFKTPEVGQKNYSRARCTRPSPCFPPQGRAALGARRCSHRSRCKSRRAKRWRNSYKTVCSGKTQEAPCSPTRRDEAGFNKFLKSYKAALPVEQAAAAWAQGK